MLALLLLIIGILARTMGTIPNFSPVVALALFGGVYLNKKYAILLPVVLMMISDLFIGLHNVVLFTWGSLVLVSVIGIWLRDHKTKTNIITTSLGAAFVFFLITNLGVWLMGYYPLTLAGLRNCYFLAIPFFRSTLLSTVVYSIAFFGIYEFASLRLRQTRFAHVL